MNTPSMNDRRCHERHAEFWELLWTVIGSLALALMFVLLNLRLTR